MSRYNIVPFSMIDCESIDWLLIEDGSTTRPLAILAEHDILRLVREFIKTPRGMELVRNEVSFKGNVKP
jgi:hypothetical protein